MGNSDFITSMLPLAFLFVVFYLLILRPQQKQAKDHKKMLSELRKGDKVMTNGGIFGEIVRVEEEFVKLRVDDNTVIKFDKTFILKKIDINEQNKEEQK